MTTQHKIFGARVTVVLTILVAYRLSLLDSDYTLCSQMKFFLFKPLITSMFLELEIKGKNQNEIMARNKHLRPTVPFGVVTSARATTAPSAWPKKVGLGGGLVHRETPIVPSLTSGNKLALLGWFSVLGAGSVVPAEPRPWPRKPFSPRPGWQPPGTGGSSALTSDGSCAAPFQPLPSCLPMVLIHFGASCIYFGFTTGRTGVSALSSFLRIAHCPTSSDLPAGIKCRANGGLLG